MDEIDQALLGAEQLVRQATTGFNPLPIQPAPLSPQAVMQLAQQVARQEVAQRLALMPVLPGPRGEPGEPGRDGFDGNDGAAGKHGRDGKDGRDGKTGKNVEKILRYPDTRYADSGGSSLVGFLSSGTAPTYGFATRTAATKMGDVYSVKDFKCADGTAVQGDATHDDATGLQSAIDWCLANGKRLYIPGARYKFGTGLTFTNANSGGFIFGDSTGDYLVSLGTSLEFSGASGAALTLVGVNSPFPIELQNITIKGNANADAGLKIFSASNVRLSRVTIRDFTKNQSSALYLTTTVGSDFTGVFTAEECVFNNNYRDGYNDSANTTTVTFDRCQFRTGTYGFVNGSTAIATAIRTANFRACLFETKGNTEIYSGGGAQSWNIDQCYFEWSGTRSPIIFDGSGSSPISNGICVKGCAFVGLQADSNGFVNITATLDGFRFENNYGTSASYTSSKYGVYHSSGTLTNYYVERVGVVSGATYPGTCRVNSTNYSSTQVKVQDNITFNGTLTAASGAAATGQLLNAYEEGTFTPTITGTSGTSNHTYSTQQGRYTRIGRIVFFLIEVGISAKDAGMTGNAILQGLPFNAAGGFTAAAAIGFIQNVTLSAGYAWQGAYVQSSNAYVNLQEFKSAAAAQALPSANISATSYFIVSGTYQV